MQSQRRAIHEQLFTAQHTCDSFANLLLHNCVFDNCSIGVPFVDPTAPYHKQQHDLTRRPLISRVELICCAIRGSAGCGLHGAVVEDITVDGLRTDGLVQNWAAVFRHVTLKGKIDRLMLSDLFHPGYPTSQFQQSVAKANAEYYATVDWALDIREAEFKDFDCRGVPSRLVRHDPETQMMVTRERLIASGNAIAVGGPYWERMLKTFLQRDPYPDALFVAPKRDKHFKELVAGIHQLRRAGVTEQD